MNTWLIDKLHKCGIYFLLWGTLYLIFTKRNRFCKSYGQGHLISGQIQYIHRVHTGFIKVSHSCADWMLSFANTMQITNWWRGPLPLLGALLHNSCCRLWDFVLGEMLYTEHGSYGGCVVFLGFPNCKDSDNQCLHMLMMIVFCCYTTAGASCAGAAAHSSTVLMLAEIFLSSGSASAFPQLFLAFKCAFLARNLALWYFEFYFIIDKLNQVLSLQ